MRKELSANSEDELLELQEGLLSGRTRPAARATRVKRKGPEKAPADVTLGDHAAGIEYPKSAGSTVLGEIVERDTSGCDPPTVSPVQASLSSFPEVMDRRSSKFALRRKAGKKNPPTKQTIDVLGSEIKSTPSVYMGENASVSEENISKLASMSRAEMLEAKRDLRSRFSPETLKFLAKRGAKKNSSRKDSLTFDPKLSESRRNVSTGGAAVSSSSDADQNPSTTVDLPPRGHFPACACLRFDLDGDVVGVVSPEELNSKATLIERALERDVLRQEERDKLSDGYTLEEWSILGRSQFVGHRSMSMMALMAILRKARPSVLNLKAGWKYQGNAIHIPDGIVLNEDADWVKIWTHSINDIDIGGLALEALKCGTSSVVSGAVKLLVALCGMPIAEEAVFEACDSDPIGGWPTIPLVPVVRPGQGGVWEAYPAPDETNIQEPTRGSLLCKLVKFGLLDQFSHILEQGSFPSFLAVILPLLLACGRSGVNLTMLVVQSKPIMTAFKESLNMCLHKESLSTSLETSYQALKVVRVLAQSGLKVLQMLKFQGVLEIVRQNLFSLWMGNDSRAADKTSDGCHLGLKVESLRIWRVCIMNGIALASLTDLFPCMCKTFCVPIIPDPGHDAHAQIELAKSYLLAKEIYLTTTFGLKQALKSQSHSTPSNPAAVYVPILSEAKLWLEKESINQVAALWKGSIQNDELYLPTTTTTSQMVPFSIPCTGYLAVGALCAATGFVSICYNLSPQPLTGHWMEKSLPQLRDLLVEKITLKYILEGFERQMDGLICLDWRSKVTASLAGSILWATEASGSTSTSSPLVCFLLDGIRCSIADKEEPSELPHSLDEPLLSQQQSCIYVSKLVVSLLQVCVTVVKQNKTLLHVTPAAVHHAVDIGVHLLTMLPPGFETWGLVALTSITSMELLGPVLQSAIGNAEDILHANPIISKNVNVYQETASPVSKLDLLALSDCLQISYAVSWLSLVPVDGIKQKVRVSLAHSHEAMSLYPEASSVVSLAGSRLPLPLGWPLMEAYCIPVPNSVFNSSCNPVCGAILLVLGLESSSSKALARIPVGSKLRSLMHLVYLAQLDELCPGELGQKSEVWQDDWVRKGLASLSQLYCSQMHDNGQVLSRQVGKPFISQILDKFTSSSFGDPLFGSHIALLLQSEGNDEVIKWVCQGLNECDALELLPKMEQWPWALPENGRVLVSQSTFDYIKSIVESSRSERLLNSWVMEYFKVLTVSK